MLIRSQDKRKLAMFEGASIDEGCNRVFVNGWRFGDYSTEEKAIKVLDMIQDAYARCESVKVLSGGTMVEVSKAFSKEKADEFCKEHRATFVFQMPKDEDVEV